MESIARKYIQFFIIISINDGEIITNKDTSGLCYLLRLTLGGTDKSKLN